MKGYTVDTDTGHRSEDGNFGLLDDIRGKTLKGAIQIARIVLAETPEVACSRFGVGVKVKENAYKRLAEFALTLETLNLT